MITLDHAIVLTRSLDAAALAYQRLGFLLTPRGRHDALGTANHTVMFARDYLELMTVETPGPGNERWGRRLARGEGLAMLALATDDARATRRTLAERGIPAAEPIDFGRRVQLPAGAAEARFTVCQLDDSASPALPAFFCQHHTPDLVWRPEYQHHPNTARSVAGLTVVTPDPARLVPAYERLLGRARVHPRPGGITLVVGGAQVWLVTRSYASARLGRRLPQAAGPIGMTVLVADLTAARQVLAANAVPFRGFAPRSILIEPTFTHGVFLELLAS